MGDGFRETLDRLVNRRGQSAEHLIMGMAITVGAVAISALIATRNAPTDGNPKVKAAYDALELPAFQPPKVLFGLIWPPMFVALTLSGLRLWNAPPSPARARAMGLWEAIQGLNALWMALGPRRLGRQLATAVATFAAACGYAVEARKVDAPASNLVVPYVGWISFACLLTAEFWRKNR